MEITMVFALMEQKKAKLRDFQKITQQMIECPREELERLVAEREKLILSIDRLDEKIRHETEGLEEDDPVCQAVLGILEGGGHDETVGQIFVLAREMRALLGQIREDDIQAALRLRVEQEQILDQIRAANQAGQAKGARFYSVSAAKSRMGSRLGKA